MHSKSFAQNIKCILGLIFLPPQHKPTKCECQRKLPERRNYLPKRSTPAKVPSWLNWMESKFNFEAEIVETPKSFNSIIDGCNWISLKTIGFRQRQGCVTNHKPVKFKQLWNFQICLISSDMRGPNNSTEILIMGWGREQFPEMYQKSDNFNLVWWGGPNISMQNPQSRNSSKPWFLKAMVP